MTDAELDEIEARANAATPGAWECFPGGPKWWWVGPKRESQCKMLEADAAFVAAARTDVPALVAEVRRLRGLLATALGETLWCPECRYHDSDHGAGCTLGGPVGRMRGQR